jgi:hypothetical protein
MPEESIPYLDPLRTACQRSRWQKCVAQAAAGDTESVALYFNYVQDNGTDAFLSLTRDDFLSDVAAVRSGNEPSRMLSTWLDTSTTI